MRPVVPLVDESELSVELDGGQIELKDAQGHPREPLADERKLEQEVHGRPADALATSIELANLDEAFGRARAWVDAPQADIAHMPPALADCERAPLWVSHQRGEILLRLLRGEGPGYLELRPGHDDRKAKDPRVLQPPMNGRRIAGFQRPKADVGHSLETGDCRVAARAVAWVALVALSFGHAGTLRGTSRLW